LRKTRADEKYRITLLVRQLIIISVYWTRGYNVSRFIIGTLEILIIFNCRIQGGLPKSINRLLNEYKEGIARITILDIPDPKINGD